MLEDLVVVVTSNSLKLESNIFPKKDEKSRKRTNVQIRLKTVQYAL